MKTSTYRIFILSLVVLTLLPSCSPASTPSTPTKQIQSGKKSAPVEQGQYLSMTYTEYVNGKNTDQGMVMRVMTYDLSSKKMTKLADVPYTSQYPLSVVYLPDHKIYYSADVDDKGDQLFSYDLNSKKTEQLSNNLFAINRIVPTTLEGPLVLAAVKKGESTLKTIFYDKSTHTMQFLHDENQDEHTWSITYNPAKKAIYNTQYSDKEQRKEFNIASKKNTFSRPPNYKVTEINNAKQERTVITLKNEQILSMSSSNDQLLLVTARFINHGNPEYSLVDITTGKRTKLELPISSRSFIYMSPDGKGVYYLGSTSLKNQEEGRGVYYYDFTSKIQTPIFIQKEGFINNFMLLNK
ncbi:hypothetical protein G9G63_13985 [Paenibacillus sp. EKM202P]|uniref:hypothetical protein n=1 Tax=unclassified Paenibacillus TaxID=185978 RepID=UPI0013EA6058|nr:MULTISPECIES: hypothetical protein [unclassified Paenibacillus]KAF6563506.1 hypothetical protein G9G63_13985 [Paenibacillus sp. EKM202P]KAF6570126.1 hypothetical protein G9G64_10890 [Paenibacillus sp. EKM207P]